MKIVREFNNVKLEIELTGAELERAAVEHGALMNEWDAAIMTIEHLNLYEGSPYGHQQECLNDYPEQIAKICEIVNYELVNWTVDDEYHNALITKAIDQVFKNGENA